MRVLPRMKPSPARYLWISATFIAIASVFATTHSYASESEVAVTGCVVDFGSPCEARLRLVPLTKQADCDFLGKALPTPLRVQQPPMLRCCYLAKRERAGVMARIGNSTKPEIDGDSQRRNV